MNQSMNQSMNESINVRLYQAWALIRASTGIADPELFIEKHLNCDQLETQMMELKQASRSRAFHGDDDGQYAFEPFHTLKRGLL